MGADFRFACVECGFDCAGDGWNKLKKEICKNVTKKILFIILNKNGFFCVRKLQKEVQKDRKTYTPRIPSDEPFFVRSQA